MEAAEQSLLKATEAGKPCEIIAAIEQEKTRLNDYEKKVRKMLRALQARRASSSGEVLAAPKFQWCNEIKSQLLNVSRLI